MKAILIAIVAVVTLFAPVRADSPVIITAFGDSLAAGYGLKKNEGFVPVLQAHLREQGLPVKVINAAIAGDTTSDALARVDWMLEDKPDIVIVEFGANDMFRGIPIALTQKNFDAIIRRIQQTGAHVLLAGMFAPNNYGEKYKSNFKDLYKKLSVKYDVPLYPFFLFGVALQQALNLPDGIHPNADGVKIIVNNIAPQVAGMVRNLRQE
ncbi:arylesterase [Candidatus Persebacteraceae bacterium Df01]|jgi:acyl-CoA thioesterase-1|uniref:Arylesterase n=1 Tax=Candidatus Doriopsillibacter californiensis TaxID=2970740 RepID=A0ABT7QN10_9GAMM|nr:arylesterase [Candidatus Persebacteraceae bacterium Df01]